MGFGTFPQVATDADEGLGDGPEPLHPYGLSVVERIVDPLVRAVLLPVDALRVELQRHLDTVPSPFGDRGCRNTGVEPQGHPRVPQVVQPPSQGRGDLFRREGRSPSRRLHIAVGCRSDDVAPLGLKDLPVLGCPELGDVLPGDLRQDGRGRDRPALGRRTELEPGLLVSRPAVRPLRPRFGQQMRIAAWPCLPVAGPVSSGSRCRPE